MSIRYDWSLEELIDLYAMPLMELMVQAAHVHARFHPVGQVQVCHLISIKTGGCSEDCKYCAQSAHYTTSVNPLAMLTYDVVIEEARQAIAKGASRICLGAAWRNVRDSRQFQNTLRMVKGIAQMGAEVCCTLGMLSKSQAAQLKEAGLYAYNHNLDSSEKFYQTIISTRTYQDRLDTLDVVANAGLSVCCGGIVGMGETAQDRLELLHVLCKRRPHPDSVPINRLCAIPGTPFARRQPFSCWELVRLIAMARIIMPASIIRLSAGRIDMSFQEQALCFFAGANSIFGGEKLLTVSNSSEKSDAEMFKILGLKQGKAYARCTR